MPLKRVERRSGAWWRSGCVIPGNEAGEERGYLVETKRDLFLLRPIAACPGRRNLDDDGAAALLVPLDNLRLRRMFEGKDDAPLTVQGRIGASILRTEEVLLKQERVLAPAFLLNAVEY